MVDGSLPILFVGARDLRARSVSRLWNERSLEIEINKMSEGARRGSPLTSGSDSGDCAGRLLICVAAFSRSSSLMSVFSIPLNDSKGGGATAVGVTQGWKAGTEGTGMIGRPRKA